MIAAAAAMTAHQSSEIRIRPPMSLCTHHDSDAETAQAAEDSTVGAAVPPPSTHSDLSVAVPRRKKSISKLVYRYDRLTAVLSKKSKYGLKALLVLAQEAGHGPVLIADLAERDAIPKKFLEAILLELKRRGLVRAGKGRAAATSCAASRPRSLSAM